MKKERYSLFSDGGARGNPGPAGIGFLVFKGKKLIKFDGKYIGISTNNKAEYKALIMGLKQIQKLNIKEIVCYLDSELIVKQIKGEYKVKSPDLKPLFETVQTYLSKIKNISFVHIPRSSNSFADKLANIALDAAEDSQK
ncbi:reverse transcriptase-like protein [Candidatus Dojkabacteria bacterium]|nr:reverse transcriptase-like protein [Candidatus Dojkabacteria bacterium]